MRKSALKIARSLMRNGRKKGVDPRPKMLYNEFIGNDKGRKIFCKKSISIKIGNLKKRA